MPFQPPFYLIFLEVAWQVAFKYVVASGPVDGEKHCLSANIRLQFGSTDVPVFTLVFGTGILDDSHFKSSEPSLSLAS